MECEDEDICPYVHERYTAVRTFLLRGKILKHFFLLVTLPVFMLKVNMNLHQPAFIPTFTTATSFFTVLKQDFTRNVSVIISNYCSVW